MSTMTTYGLAACIWRRLRALHPGGDLEVYGRDGLPLGTAYLYRYDAAVALPNAVAFGDVSWKRTLHMTPTAAVGLLGPTPIPIGATRWG